MANTFTLEKKVNLESCEKTDGQDDLKAQICKLKELKDTIGDVINMRTVVKYEAKDIIEKIENDLCLDYDTKFLQNYYNVLKNNNAAFIQQVTNDILWSIQRALRRQNREGKPFDESEAVLMAAWLSAAALWSEPRAPRAGRALHALLATIHDFETIERVARMWLRTAPADVLLELSDATRAPPAPATAPPALSDLLLHGALHALTAAPDDRSVPRWSCGAPRPKDVLQAVGSLRPDVPRRLLLSVAARVLAAERSDSLLEDLARAMGSRNRAAYCDDRVQVDTSLLKFQMLFGKSDALELRKKRKRRSDESNVTKEFDDVRKKYKKKNMRYGSSMRDDE